MAKPANRIEAQCVAAGLRMTGQRRVIARVLSASEDHPDVEELYRRVSAIEGDAHPFDATFLDLCGDRIIDERTIGRQCNRQTGIGRITRNFIDIGPKKRLTAG